MICKEVHKKMNSYLSEKLNKATFNEFELHLKDCASCRQIISEVKNTMTLADRTEELSADPFMFTRIQAQIENRSTERNRSWQKVLQPIAVTMIMLVGLFAGVSLGSKYYNDSLQLNANEYVLESEDEEIYLNALAYESIETFLLTDN